MFGYILYGFQMFDVFNHNEKAQYVLMAIKLPAGQILATVFLLMIMGYCFTSVAFIKFRGELVNANQCDSLVTCFLTVFTFAPRLSGGIGDFLSPDLRTDHDMYPVYIIWSFVSFVLVNVIVLNVLFGIIVDTFGQLRATEAESEKDISNVCFICGLDRQVLDREGSGFSDHINTEHQKWNYMKYIVYLREKDANDYNGLEHHVVDCIDTGDNGWFPVNKAMCIMQNKDPNDDIETREREEILRKLNEIQEEFLEMRNNMSNLTASINTNNERSPNKFATVVDSVMQKSRVSQILQMYMASKQKER